MLRIVMKCNKMMNPVFLGLLCLVLMLHSMQLAACSGLPPAGAHALRNASLETMAGQMVLAGFRGTTLEDQAPILRDLNRLGLGGAVLFDRDVVLGTRTRNILNPKQLARLTARLRKTARIPPFLGVDQEGGAVARLRPERGFPATVSAAALGREGNLTAARLAGRNIGETLRRGGLNLDFAPVVDLDFGDKSPAIGRLGRSFSADPEQAAAYALAFIRGLHDAGVLSCLKHFPGHGSAGGDTHLGFTDVTDVWSRKELVPFRRIIDAGEADMIMTAHIANRNLDPDGPATFSKAVIQGLLRGELGYDGVVITDDLQMGAVAQNYGFEQAVRQSVLAGADILLFGNNLSYDPDVAAKARNVILDMVRSKEVDKARIAKSWERIMRLKAKLEARPAH